jgi:hypothetical protein
MNLAPAIEQNRNALLRIVAMLFAMLGLSETAAIGRIPRELHRAVLHILRPTEMALRLLIAAAARGLVLKPKASRPIPKGKIIEKGKGGASRPVFRLEDIHPRTTQSNTRTRSERSVRGTQPRQTPADAEVNAARLTRRLQAMLNALQNLPREAKRFVRWKAKGEQVSEENSIRSALSLKVSEKPTHEIDEVLEQCRGLAGEARLFDSS